MPDIKHWNENKYIFWGKFSREPMIGQLPISSPFYEKLFIYKSVLHILSLLTVCVCIFWQRNAKELLVKGWWNWQLVAQTTPSEHCNRNVTMQKIILSRSYCLPEDLLECTFLQNLKRCGSTKQSKMSLLVIECQVIIKIIVRIAITFRPNMARRICFTRSWSQSYKINLVLKNR